MKAATIFSWSLIALVSAGPVVNDCGKKKCYKAKNECGMEYGGCWEECANGPTSIQTFVIPQCSMDEQLLDGRNFARQARPKVASTTTTPTSRVPKASITSPPSQPPSMTAPKNSTDCIRTCVDLITVCDEGSTLRWGDCQSECGAPSPHTSKSCSRRPRPASTTSAGRRRPGVTTSASARRKKIDHSSRTPTLPSRTPNVSPRPSPIAASRTPSVASRTPPVVSPRPTPNASSRTPPNVSPRPQPIVSSRQPPKVSSRPSPTVSPRPTPNVSSRRTPNVSSRTPSIATPRPSPTVSPRPPSNVSSRTPNVSPRPSNPSPKASPSPKAGPPCPPGSTDRKMCMPLNW